MDYAINMIESMHVVLLIYLLEEKNRWQILAGAGKDAGRETHALEKY